MLLLILSIKYLSSISFTRFVLLLVAYILLGVLSGIATGLLPGLHANNMAMIVVGLSISLGIPPLYAAVYIFSCLITHTFFDFIPSTYIGVPDDATSLSVLPAHRMLLKGDGHLAVKLSAIGSLFAAMYFLLIFPAMFALLIYTPLPDYIEKFILLILISVVLYLFLLEWEKGGARNVLYATLLFSLSGFLGYLALKTPYSTLCSSPFIPISFGSLFPLLTGLFGTSTLLISTREVRELPKQNLREDYRLKKKDYIAMVKGSSSGALVGLLPGVSSGIATVIASGSEGTDERYILTMGTVNTSNAFFNLLALFTLGKARNGALVQLQRITDIPKMSSYYTISDIFAFMVLAGAIASVLSYFLVIILSRCIAKGISSTRFREKYGKIMKYILFGIFAFVFVFSGPFGLLLCVIATLLGILPPKLGVQRVHLMGCIILPVILYFI